MTTRRIAFFACLFILVWAAAMHGQQIINAVRDFIDISTPSAPSSGHTRVYSKGGLLCSESPAAAETCMGSGAPSGSAGGDLSGSYPNPSVAGLDSVPLCSGFSPTNGQFLQYTTGGSPDPCYTAGSAGGGSLSAAGFYLYDGTYYYIPNTMTVATLPSAGNYAWVNQGGASETASGNGLILYAPGAAGTSWRLRTEAIASYTTLVAAFSCTYAAVNYGNCGVGFYRSANGKMMSFDVSVSTHSSSNLGIDWQVERWTNTTTYSSTAADQSLNEGRVVWVKLVLSSSTLYFYWSQDGVNWVQIETEASSSFLGGNPDYFFYGASSGNGIPVYNTLLSWNTQ